MHEKWEGRPLSQYGNLSDRPIKNTGYVADTYASAWHSVLSTNSFEAAIADAINRGGDADTVGAVTGMIVGRTKHNRSEMGAGIHLDKTLMAAGGKLLRSFD